MFKTTVEGTHYGSASITPKYLSSFLALLILAGCNHQSTPSSKLPEQPALIKTHYLPQEPLISTAPIPSAEVSTQPIQSPNAWEVLANGENLGDASHQRVQQQIRLLKNKQRHFDILSQRAAPYFYPIIKELQKRQMPLFLALIPMIESGYQAHVNSSWNAAGLWQIIPSTGKYLKLKQNWWYDGRLDPQASTEAALTYLQELHQRFDDWPLALAAYNSGGATVSNAIKKNRKAKRAGDYWSLKLPPETRVYIPKIIALDLIIKNPARYGIKLKEIPLAPQLQSVDTDGQLALQKAAELANIDLTTLRKLNPALKRWATDPKGPDRLILPLKAVPTFKLGLARLAKEDRVIWRHYTVKKGDTLSQIADNFAVSVKLLKTSNQLKTNNIKIGKRLLIPNENSSNFNLARATQKKTNTQLKNNKYKIKSGDSLWQIARNFDLHVNQILKWNNIKLETPLKPGQELTILLDH